MTSLNGNIFRVTSSLWGESTGHRWIPLTKASNTELSSDVFFDLCTVEQTIEKPVICDAISRSLWRHCNASTWLVHQQVQCWRPIPGVTEISLVINDFEYVFADHVISFNMANKVSRNIAELEGFIQPAFFEGKSTGHQWFP